MPEIVEEILQEAKDKISKANKKTMKEQLTGTGTLSQPIKMNAHDLFPSTSIFATTIDGELTDVINIKDCFNRLPQDEKLKVVSVLLEFCAAETRKLTNQNK